MSSDIFFSGDALRVDQPLGTFFVVSISAAKLLEVCYSDKASLDADKGEIRGTQRKEDEKRQLEIAEYIRSKEAAFPNSVIIGANYTADGDFIEGGDGSAAWTIEESSDGKYKLIIPTGQQLASIIDGQHRLRSFNNVSYEERERFQLLCSVYIDLPIPYHAYLFSTINFNQKKVDRSLAYNLFGFDIDASEPEKWVPETLAVSIARRLNVDGGPFSGAIILGVSGASVSHDYMKLSMATIVDGLLKLFSKKPKKDRSFMMQYSKEKRSRDILDDDGSPLRFLFREGYDDVIYNIVVDYFSVVKEFFWDSAAGNSYVYKTVGVQAFFDILNALLSNFPNDLNGDEAYFRAKLAAARDADIDFSGIQASGIGKAEVRRRLEAHIEFPSENGA